METSTSASATLAIPRASRFRRALVPTLIALACMAFIAIGVVLAYVPYANNSNALQAALQYIESGAVPNEPADYARDVSALSRSTPDAALKPGTYSNITEVGGVTYNAVLALHEGGKYDYALTVGTPRVYKLYKHAGRWWIEGNVLYTVFKEGNEFLTSPAARDGKTPSREKILSVDDNQVTLQSHYGGPVIFSKAKP